MAKNKKVLLLNCDEFFQHFLFYAKLLRRDKKNGEIWFCHLHFAKFDSIFSKEIFKKNPLPCGR